MKYTPRYVIYIAVCNYLSEEKIEELRKDLADEFPKRDRKFIDVLSRHFDFDKFTKSPYLKEDWMIYNYLNFEWKGSKLHKTGLIAKYEKNVVLPQKMILNEVKEILNL